VCWLLALPVLPLTLQLSRREHNQFLVSVSAKNESDGVRTNRAIEYSRRMLKAAVLVHRRCDSASELGKKSVGEGRTNTNSC
jgi:hypothetical protein